MTNNYAFGWVPWVPANAHIACTIYEWGGPLVDLETGEVLAPAEIREAAWHRIVEDLPPDFGVRPGRPVTANTEAIAA